MARVWFVRRRGGQWIAPGGTPALVAPLAELIFPLDVGTHRRVSDDPPIPAPEIPSEPPESLQRVFIEVEPRDLGDLEFSGYGPGVYDSPYSPREAMRRFGQRHPVAARASA